MDISIIGTGYVGLVAGVSFAETGNDVVCIDIDSEKISLLKKGRVTFYEPGLSELLKRNLEEGRLKFSNSIAEGISKAGVIFVAVGTPEGEDGSADLSHVLEVAREIARGIVEPKVVVLKSTVPVGTADLVRETIEGITGFKVTVANNPEFLKEGTAVEDFLKPDRVVIGTDDQSARAVLGELYAPFVRTQNPIIFMDNRSAEMTKYASNSLLAVRISFINEIANLCEKVGADVESVRKGMGADRRIGYQFLFPGVGFGGSCFPKDISALIRTARDAGMSIETVEAAQRANILQRKSILNKIVRHFGENLKGTVTAIWGLSFKPRTDDMREAPSIPTINGLLDRGAEVRAHDPGAREIARKLFGSRITVCDNSYEAAKGADGLAVLTEWNEFRHPNFARLKSLMRQPVLFDGRNVYDPKKVRGLGFTYYSIGRL